MTTNTTPSGADALRIARAHIKWLAFGDCRADGWEGPPPTASQAVAEIDAALSAAQDAPAQAAQAVTQGWPRAAKEQRDQGWTLDYRFLERVTDLAAPRTEYSTSMEATEQVLIAALEVLAAAPAAPQPAAQQGEARVTMPDDIERMAVNRYRPVPSGVLAYKVVGGDGDRSLFSGTKDECRIVARKLTEAFLDGAHVALTAPAAPQPAAQQGGVAEAATNAMTDFEVTKSIIYKCPALRLPQSFVQRLGMTAQIVALKGATPEMAEFIAAACNEKTEIAAQAQEAAPAAQGEPSDPLQGAANWFLEAIGGCTIGTLQQRLLIGFNRAERLMRAARAAQQKGGAE